MRTILLIILALILPPLAAFLVVGLSTHFWINKPWIYDDGELVVEGDLVVPAEELAKTAHDEPEAPVEQPDHPQ